MQIIIHRVNTIAYLKTIPRHYGIEIDVRGYGKKLLLNHDPINDPQSYDELEDFLRNYRHKTIVFNMKEAGYEQDVIDLAKKYKIKDYFLLDVEFPYLYRATRKDGVRNIAVRYSEAEPIEAILAQKSNGKTLLDWVWIDTNTCLPLDLFIKKKLSGFKTCLVCPERWGRLEDIPTYKNKLIELDIQIDAVMTSLACAPQWE